MSIGELEDLFLGLTSTALSAEEVILGDLGLNLCISDTVRGHCKILSVRMRRGRRL